MKSVSDIRKSFLDFFEKENHKVLPSGPLVPHNDPTLMFTNAGMVQFKNIFTGTEKSDVKRAATSQKCVRAGGKHNDLDNVGYTARHHTFFEMLGNFSFGDYFKENAIELGWKFLTKELKISPEKLMVTVYHTDDEAFNTWKKVSGFSDNKIIRIPTNDNFWAMGDTGPCGPCSEIFYDHGESIAGGPPGSADADGDRFVEIWNLVFMQYEQLEDGKRINLPKPSIDTGMGLERLATVLQGVQDNYDIDLFKKIIAASKEFSGNSSENNKASHRIIADHLRSSSFLIADGVMPSNEGRGYVLRRIMRRAMRHAHQLGCKDPLMYKLVPTLVDLMGKQFPELGRAQNLVIETLKLEEQRFKETLERGLKLLDEETANIKNGGVFSGDTAFKLYDTFGFPIDLTQDILRGKSINVDMKGFEAAMQQQKEKARASWSGSGESSTDKIWFSQYDQYKDEISGFLGYDLSEAQGKVLGILKESDDKKLVSVESASVGDSIFLLANQTPFYAESGGQVGDTGKITNNKELEIQVTDTKKMAELHWHVCKVIKGKVQQDDIVTLKIDEGRRNKLRANHSATHILHKVLRDKLGEHVTQKGSLVAEDKLRFDFSHPQPIPTEKVEEIENEINKIINGSHGVSTKVMNCDDAMKSGAMALFGEKYADEVRVVQMGDSIELCGGTHVKKTSDIGLFKITSQKSVAAGIRRFEAATGADAQQFMKEKQESSQKEELLKKEKEALAQKELAALSGIKDKLVAEAKPEMINGVPFVFQVVDLPAKDLKPLVDEFKKKIGSGVVVTISGYEGKVSIVTGVTNDLIGRISAVDVVKVGAEALGGKGGGGRPDMAQAGGSDISKHNEALQKIKAMIK